MAFSTTWSLSCLLKYFKNTPLPEAMSGLLDQCYPMLGDPQLKCVLSFGIWGPCLCVQICSGCWIHDGNNCEDLGLSPGMWPGQTPGALFSHLWVLALPNLYYFLRPSAVAGGTSSSNERLPSSLFKLLLVLPTQTLHLVRTGGWVKALAYSYFTSCAR